MTRRQTAKVANVHIALVMSVFDNKKARTMAGLDSHRRKSVFIGGIAPKTPMIPP
jgi:hypothetical protein